MTSVADLVKDPAWLPEGYDAVRDVVRFARIDRAGLIKEAFLDQRMAGSVAARAEAPFAAVASLVDKPFEPPRFIFHTAFCCSTLLARALDAPGASLALKEPNILLDAANAGRVNEKLRRDPASFARLCRTILALLARPHLGNEKVVIKPTNTASTLAPHALALGAPSLFLYGDLKEFLISLLKKGEEGRSFVRGQYNIYALDGVGLAALPSRQAMSFTDLQVAAVVWRHQGEQFQRLLAGAKAASLDFRVLLADPARTLKSAARHLRLPIADATLDATAQGDIFARNSKFADVKYDASQRDAEETALLERWSAEIDLITRWAGQLNLGGDLKLPLPKALAI